MILGRLVIANYFLFTLLLLILVSLQCSLWLQFFSHFPAPQFWLPFLVYWSTYRHFTESFFMMFLLTTICSSLTSLPFGIFLIINMILIGLFWGVKRRIFWNNASYSMLLSGAGCLLFPIIHFVISLIVEAHPIQDFLFFDWTLSALLTALITLPSHLLFQWFDRLTKKELPTEAGQSVYE